MMRRGVYCYSNRLPVAFVFDRFLGHKMAEREETLPPRSSPMFLIGTQEGGRIDVILTRPRIRARRRGFRKIGHDSVFTQLQQLNLNN